MAENELDGQLLRRGDHGFRHAGPRRLLGGVVRTRARWSRRSSTRSPRRSQAACGLAKLNIDDNIRTAQRFGVMSIPTMILFKNGEEVRRIVGAMGKSKLAAEIEEYL